ncbi:hypothetical protein JOM56_009824 [Amanita muscaria]
MFAKAIISAFLALPLVAQTGLAAQCSRGYTVKEGDICDSISAANQVSTYQLAVINKGVIDAGCTNLVPGQTLCLANVGEDCNNIHVVALGDDCESVQNQAGINSTLLYHNNPQINENCSNIYVGEARFLHFVRYLNYLCSCTCVYRFSASPVVLRSRLPLLVVPLRLFPQQQLFPQIPVRRLSTNQRPPPMGVTITSLTVTSCERSRAPRLVLHCFSCLSST